MSAFTRSEIGNYGHLYYVAPEQREKLKDASAKSDLYSLGKLLNFVMTGRDPDTLYPCNFNPVIVRSTNPNPDLRYTNASEFEKTYDQIKALLQPDAKNQSKAVSFAPVDGAHTYNWQAFHKFCVDGHYESHVYDDYIQPIVAVLSDRENLNNYYAEVGGAIEEFLAIFVDRLHECYQTTKWPFSATGTFGTLLRNIYLRISEHRVKASCLKELWIIAYEQDQWSVQRIVEGLLKNHAIPDELQAEFAMMILESPAKIDEDRFASIKMPDVIRKAISQKAQGSRAKS
jgi:serine/threonine protein kinase